LVASMCFSESVLSRARLAMDDIQALVSKLDIVVELDKLLHGLSSDIQYVKMELRNNHEDSFCVAQRNLGQSRECPKEKDPSVEAAKNVEKKVALQALEISY